MAKPWSLLCLILPFIIICPIVADDALTPDIGITILSQRQQVLAWKKEKFSLNCSVKGSKENGPLNFTWFKNGELVTLSPRIKILPNGTLHFKKVLHKKPRKSSRGERRKIVSDGGWYECRVTNKFGTIIAQQIHLSVADSGKKLSISPKKYTGFIGGVASFSCHSDDVAKATWISANLNSKRFRKIGSVLHIHDLEPSDAGELQCTSNGDVATAKLRVISGDFRPSKIIAGPKNVTVTSQDKVVLECLADGNPKPDVIWSRRRGGDPLLDPSLNIVDGYLEIPHATEREEDVYICTARNLGGVDSRSASLTVNYVPLIKTKPTVLKEVYAMDFTLECDASGKPIPTLKWYKDGEVLRRYSNSQVQINYNGHLTVKEAAVEDSGYYQCIVNNSAGNTTVVSQVVIRKQAGSPELPPTNLKVTVLSESKVRVSWKNPSSTASDDWPVIYFNIVAEHGHLEHDTQHVNGNTQFEIDSLHPNTRYSFHVRSFNTKGAGPASEKIIVKTEESIPTKAPSIISLETPMPHSILVKWEPLTEAEARGRVKEYTIFYRDQSSKREKTVSGDKTQYLLTNLKSNTKYIIRVLASTAKGFPPLDTIKWPSMEKTTLAEPVDNPNFALSVILSSNSTISVDWKLVASDNVAHFNLLVDKLVGDGQIGPIKIPPTEASYKVRNLERNTWYHVTVEAVLKDGRYWVARQHILTKSPVTLPPPPEDLEGEAIEPTRIQIQWKKPQTELELAGYTVNYTVFSDVLLKADFSVSKVIESLTEKITLTDLKPFTTYRIAVRSYTSKQAGEFCNPIFIITKEDVPSPPEKITFRMISPTEVRITWQPPHKKNGKIRYYELYYTPDEKRSQWKVVKKNGTETSTDVKDLKQGEYYFKVRALTTQGEGNFSEIVLFRKTSVTDPPYTNVVTEAQPTQAKEDQTLLLILCIGAGLVIIILVVVFVKCRWFRGSRGNESPVLTNHEGPVRTGNGSVHHNEGQANGHVGIPLESMELQYVGMLKKLPTNSDVDAKGGGDFLVRDGVYKNGINLHHLNGHMQNNSINHAEEQRVTEPLLSRFMQETEGSTPNGNKLRNSLEEIDHSDLHLSQLPDEADLDDSSTPLVTGKKDCARSISKQRDANQTNKGGTSNHVKQSAERAGIGTVNQGSEGAGHDLGEGQGEQLQDASQLNGVPSESGEPTSGKLLEPTIPLSLHQSSGSSSFIAKGGTPSPKAPPTLVGSTAPSNVSTTLSTPIPQEKEGVSYVATPPSQQTLQEDCSDFLQPQTYSQRVEDNVNHLGGDAQEAEPQSAVNQQISSQPSNLSSPVVVCRKDTSSNHGNTSTQANV